MKKKIFGPDILDLIRVVICSIHIYHDSFFSSVFALLEPSVHISPFERQLQFGSLQDLLHEQEGSSKTAVSVGGPLSHSILAFSPLVSSHVLGDLEFLGGFQDLVSRLLFGSLPGMHAWTGNQHKAVVGQTRCCLSLNRTFCILAH